MRIGYFTAYYPATTHTFIRREIRALEAQGLTIVRYALRPDPQGLVEPEDREEVTRTRFIFRAPASKLVWWVALAVAKHPVRIVKAVWLALKSGYRSDRGILRHIAYVLEALILSLWCEQDGVEHLHVHFGTNPAVVGMIVHELSGLPFSFTAHGSEEFEKASVLSLDVKLKKAAFAVCVSSFGRSQLMRWTPPDQWPKISLIHCGVDDKYLTSQPQPAPEKPRLVCVGRIGEHKGQLVLVEAACHLLDAKIDFEIFLVGDGPMRPLVEDVIHRRGLERQISITGWVSGERVKTEILAARALVLPSFSENMPVAIMEAMALKRAVISTYIAGIPELVQPGKTGWLVPAGDEFALAEALHAALLAPSDQLEAMGNAARIHVREFHDASREAAKLKRLFEFNQERKRQLAAPG